MASDKLQSVTKRIYGKIFLDFRKTLVLWMGIFRDYPDPVLPDCWWGILVLLFYFHRSVFRQTFQACQVEIYPAGC